MKHRLCCFFLVIVYSVLILSHACAYESTTLRPGMKSDAVQEMQQALINQGYLSGTADGIYGTNTENAVRKFQKKHNLTADGLAGAQTLALLYGSGSGSSASASNTGTAASQGTQTSQTASTSSQTSSQASSGTTSGGSLRQGDTGSRVVTLQEQLIKLGYLSGTADGKYGKLTRAAVIRFQKANGLTADGIAGTKTLQALSADSGNSSSGNSSSGNSSSGGSGSSNTNSRIDAPAASSIKLLHWYDDIKPNLKSKSTLLIYDPSTGLSWSLQVMSKGRHCDAEPLTLQDTETMVKAFGGKNTWNQKGVYVRLPSGTWTVGSTHDMPHLTGNIKDNGFDGHLCVHFLRNMDECKEKDPNYGVSNQQTIRTLWKNLTGEVLDY